MTHDGNDVPPGRLGLPRVISHAPAKQRLRDQPPPRCPTMEQGLAIAVQAAEHYICLAEAELSEIEARLQRADSSMAVLQAVALRAGLRLRERPPDSLEGCRFLSRGQLADKMGISVRRIDQHRAGMTKDVHYHKDGARILFHVPEAVDVILARLSSPLCDSCSQSIEELADDEVIRRRSSHRRGHSSEGGKK